VLRKSDSIFICVMACVAINTPWRNAAFGSGALPTTGAAAGGRCSSNKWLYRWWCNRNRWKNRWLHNNRISNLYSISTASVRNLNRVGIVHFLHNDRVIACGCVCIRSPYNMIGTSNGSQSSDSVSGYRRWPMSMRHISLDDRS